MQAITIRPLQQGDGAFLCSLFKDNDEYYEIFHDPENRDWVWEQRVVRFLAQAQTCHHILEADAQPVGWLSYSDLSPTERELDILVLKQEYLGRGYGACALSQFLARSREAGMHSILLNVNRSNSRAIRFYEKFGFAIVAEQIIPECNDAVNLAMYQMELRID